MSSQIIADLLAKCLEAMQSTGISAAQAASRYPEHHSELLDLLQEIQALENLSLPGPSPEFRAAARTRMLNRIKAYEARQNQQVVTNQQPPRQIRQTHKLTRRLSMTWIIVIGLLAATLAGGGGAAYASTDALPGDALYPVKTTIQDLELAFAGDEGDIALLLGNLDQNVQELQQLTQLGRFDDIEIGLEEYLENYQALTQTQTRINYEDAGSEESLNERIQTRLMTHTQTFEQLKLQTQLQEKTQLKLQEAIQLTETGKTYGPNDGGKPEEPGQPNGAGPGEQQSPGKPEDAGNGDGQGQKPEDAGAGQGNQPENSSGGTGGQSAKGCQQTPDGEICKPEDIGYLCTENDAGELICEPQSGQDGYYCEKTGDGEIICKPGQPGNGNGSGNNGNNGGDGGQTKPGSGGKP